MLGSSHIVKKAEETGSARIKDDWGFSEQGQMDSLGNEWVLAILRGFLVTLLILNCGLKFWITDFCLGQSGAGHLG